MPVKKYSPVTPGTRTRVGTDYSEITTNKPEKSLIAPIKRTGGRNNSGKMTMRNRGGCLLYTSPSPRDATLSRMPSSA